MNAKTEAKESRLDLLEWFLVAVLVAVAVVDNRYFSTQSILYRVLGILILTVIAAFLALQAAKGQISFSLAKEARVEIREIAWSSRQETAQTTLIVVVVVLVVALLLRGLDSLLGRLVSMIVG